MRKWTYAAIAAIAVLGTAELAARHEGFGDPLLYRPLGTTYEPAPGQHLHRLGHAVTINALGTRGPETTANPTTWRILVLGDSVANGGTQLDDSQIFPAVAQRLLTAKGCHSEIFDASAGGWSLFDEAAWLHSHGTLGARTLVWVINSKDLDQQPSTATMLDRNPSFPTHRPAFALSEILFRYALPRLGLGPSAADNGSVGYGFDAPEYPAVAALVRRTVQDLARQGVTVTVLFHQTAQPLPPSGQRAEADLHALLQSEHIPVLDTGLRQDPHLYLDQIHPNAQGADRIGHQLADHLLAQCPRP